jgi:phage terminase small subunit
MAWYSQKSARNVASENLTKPNIRSRIDELAQMALWVIEKLTSDDTVNPSVRMTGAKDILDRAGYKPIEQHEIKWFKNDLSYLSLEDLENLKKTLNGEGNKKSD